MNRIGMSRRRPRAVSLEEGAAPGAARCPACDEPLFVWVETEGFGPREDQVVDRCENCGLAVARGAVPSPEVAAEELSGPAPNAASLQAWLGAENWAAMRPGDRGVKLTPRAAELLAAKRGSEVSRIRFLAGAGIASMWQTLLNLLTFHRDFAAEAASRRLRPGTGRGRAAYAIDVMVTILAAIPTAILAVLLEGGALLARRGGVMSISTSRGS
jgi:hypothetical protein